MSGRTVLPSCAPLLPLLALALLAGCGGGTTAPSGGATSTPLGLAQVVGTWSVTLGDTLTCADTLAGRTITFQVSGQAVDVQPFGSLNFAAPWSGAGVGGTVYGTINVQTRTAVWHLTTPDSLGDRGFEIRGTLNASAVLSGLAVDPYANYLPLLGPARCIFTAIAQRTGA